MHLAIINPQRLSVKTWERMPLPHKEDIILHISVDNEARLLMPTNT